jgi:hypothetical protein
MGNHARFLCLLLLCLAGVDASSRALLSARDHRYKNNDYVPLYANKVGPFHNPRYMPALFVCFCFFIISVSCLGGRGLGALWNSSRSENPFQEV